MLTPIDIQAKNFKSGGMGYSKADVDAFFQQVSADYASLYSENQSLKEKINNLNESLNHYRDIEKSLQKALVLAETTAEDTMTGARKNATVIEQEAVLKAQSIVADAKVELEHLKVRVSDMLRQYETYRAQLCAMAQSQLDMLSSDAFHIDTKIDNKIDSLEQDAQEHMDMLQAKPVSDPAAEEEEKVREAEPEEDLDETFPTDESIIREFDEIFEEEQSSEEEEETEENEQEAPEEDDPSEE